MFKRISTVLAAILLCVTTSACTRMVNSPADELCLYRWGSTQENGNEATLSFEAYIARFSVSSEAFSLMIEGVYLIDDENLIISDTATSMNYGFGYRVHGDSVELSCGGGTIRLEKTDL